MSLHELKPCPFCGGQADKHIDDYGEGKFYVTVRCSKCGAKVCHKGAIETATQEAVNTWNRRADEGKSEFSDAGWERLLLLFLLSFLEPPQKREISINAQINGKSVNISYDPHDAEAVKAADVWRKALFAVKDEDNVKFGEQQCRDYLKGAVERYLQNKQKHVDQAVAAMKPWTPCKPTETVKSNESAAPEPDKLDYDPLYDTLIDPLPFEYLCYWQKIAEEYSKAREAWENGKRVRIPRHITDFLSILSKRLSKDRKEAVETRWPKPTATDEGGAT